MSRFLFFSLAKHQSIYFQQLLDHTDLQGRVWVPGQLPLPGLAGIRRVIDRLDWPLLLREKCQEREVKGKSAGPLYRALLRLELLVTALRLQALLDRERPDAVVMWNGSHRYCRILRALLPDGVRTFFVENGLLPNTTTLDTLGVNYHNSVPREAEFYRQYASRRAAEGRGRVTLVPRKPRVTGLQPVALPPQYVFIPFQDDRDTQVRLYSPWVRDMGELFALGERLAAETGLTVVFKEHPSSRHAYPELHRRTHDRLFFANGNPTQELIEGAQFVITLNSTVGLESILLGKPVLTLGQAFFNVDGLVMHADSPEALIAAARRFPEWPLEETVRQGFLDYLGGEYCVPGRWQDAEPAHLREVTRRMLQELER